MNKLLQIIEENFKLSSEDILVKFGGNTEYAFKFDERCPILFMAHSDIVDRKEKVFERVNKFIYKMTGADDRLGVSIIEHLIREGYPVSYLITNYEECGGLGAKQFIKETKHLDMIKLIVSLDRRGSSHYVKYSDVKKEHQKYFDKYLKKVGIFEEGNGSYSDCDDISNAFGVAHINLAVGYHCEHTDSEYFNINETEYALYVCKNILKTPPKQRIEIEKLTHISRFDFFDKPKKKKSYDFYFRNPDDCCMLERCAFLYDVNLYDEYEVKLLKKSFCYDCNEYEPIEKK